MSATGFYFRAFLLVVEKYFFIIVIKRKRDFLMKSICFSIHNEANNYKNHQYPY